MTYNHCVSQKNQHVTQHQSSSHHPVAVEIFEQVYVRHMPADLSTQYNIVEKVLIVIDDLKMPF